MSEWLKEHAWKACVGETLPRVRIPLSPPNPKYYKIISVLAFLKATTRFLAAFLPRTAQNPEHFVSIPSGARRV